MARSQCCQLYIFTSNSFAVIAFGLFALVGLSFLRFKRGEKGFVGSMSFHAFGLILLLRVKRGGRSVFSFI